MSRKLQVDIIRKTFLCRYIKGGEAGKCFLFIGVVEFHYFLPDRIID